MDSASANADAWHDDDALMQYFRNTRRAALKVFFLLLAAAGRAHADGGVVQLRGESGPFIITLFSSPSPLHSGRADLSVLVESVQNRSALLDAAVSLDLQQNAGRHLHIPATHAAATNKLLYAALPDIPIAGTWTVTVVAQRNSTEGRLSGTLQVLPAPPAVLAYWPYFAVVPCCIGLFILNQRLKTRQARTLRQH